MQRIYWILFCLVGLCFFIWQRKINERFYKRTPLGGGHSFPPQVDYSKAYAVLEENTNRNGSRFFISKGDKTKDISVDYKNLYISKNLRVGARALKTALMYYRNQIQKVHPKRPSGTTDSTTLRYVLFLDSRSSLDNVSPFIVDDSSGTFVPLPRPPGMAAHVYKKAARYLMSHNYYGWI
jgi:hypothetical protein